MEGKDLTARGLRRGLMVTTLVLGVALLAGPSAADHGGMHINIAPATVTEGGTLSFPVTLTDRSVLDVAVTMQYGTSNGSAQAPDDYAEAGGTLTFGPGDSEENVSVSTVADNVDELDETLTVALSNASSGEVSGSPATGTITDDDTATLSIEDGAAVVEGGSRLFTARLSTPSVSTVSANWAVNHGTTGAVDFNTPTSGAISFDPGETTKTIPINTADDGIDEATETFTVVLSSVMGAPVADGTASGSVTDDDTAPSVSIGNANAVTEGAIASFAVTLSAPSGQTVTVDYFTTHGSTTAADFSGPTSGSVTFSPGQTSKSIDLPTVDDTADENDSETFTVMLSSPSNATLGGQSTGNGAISDNDDPPSLSISDVTHAEGTSIGGTTTFLFGVSLSAASGKQVTVNYATQNGTALSGSDYTHTTGSLTFSPGTTSQTIEVLVAADGVSEPTENLFVNLSSATNATGTPSGTGTIVNDDSQPSLSIEDKAVAEGVGNATFDVTLNAPSGETVQVNYSTSDGPSPAATGNVDYTHQTGGLLVFAPGETTKTVTVPITQDVLDEPDEKFTISLSNESNATVSKRNAIATIGDDDGTPSVSIGNAPAVTEGAQAQFPVTLSTQSGQAVTVSYALSHGTTTGGDFSTPPPLTGSITIVAGQTTGTISIQTSDDILDESDQESFMVAITGASGANVGSPSSGTGTVNDNDASPAVTIGNAAAVTEGASATFIVSLSAPSGRQVTVGYALTHGTTSAADFTGAMSGTVAFAAGDTSETISIATVNDTTDEADQETFTVALSSPTNATLGTPSSGSGAINDNDNPPTVSIGNAAPIAEGGAASFPVTLSAQSGRPVTVNWAVAHGSTTAADLGTPLSGTVSFTLGDPLTKLVTVPTVDDAFDEADQEMFTVTLSAPANATIATPSGTGTINDNDALPTVSIANAAPTAEGAPASFPVTLSAASGRTVTVNYAASHGTTTAADLSGPLTGIVTFAPGDPLTRQVQIATVDDPLDEADQETFTVTLSSASSATLGTASGTGTINDNDALPTLSISDGDAREGNSGALGACGTPPPAGQLPTGCVFVKISLSAASGRKITVQWSTANGTAVAPDDFAAVSPTTLTFEPGAALSQTVGVPIVGDITFESNETFNVNLSAAMNATIGDGQGEGRILDEDSEPRLTVTGAQELEGNPDDAIVVVALSPAAGVTVTVSFFTSNGTAFAGTDYTAIPPSVFPCSGPAGAVQCTLTFTPGQTSKAVTINLINDSFDEADETFTVNLSNEQNAEILNANDRRGFVTIRDDDPLPSVSIGDATVSEGESGAVSADFSVTLSAASGRAVSVNYAAGNGTATAPEDYAGTSGTLTFASGETSETITVPVSGDEVVESAETFFVNLWQPNAVSIGDGQGVGTILDDDEPPPPPPPPPPNTDTTTTTTASTATTTSSTTTTRRRTTAPSVLTGMKISNAPVILLDNLAPIGVTCSRTATKSCLGTVVMQGQARTLAVVDGRPKVKAVRLGREPFAIARGRSENVLVRLSRRAVKAVKRAGRLRVTVVVTARDSAGKRAKPITKKVWLKSAKKPRPKRTRS